MGTLGTERLPRSWTKTARSGVLHAVSLAFTAVTSAWGVGATSKRGVTRLKAELDRAQTEIALLREELAIKDARWRRVPPRHRPHYGPVERMRILKVKAARNWSGAQAAERFFVTTVTIATWLERVDEAGERALVQLKEPVIRFPDYVRDLVRWLKSVCPTLGKVRIAQALARAGLSLGATTVGRMLNDATPEREPDDEALEAWDEAEEAGRVLAELRYSSNRPSNKLGENLVVSVLFALAATCSGCE